MIEYIRKYSGLMIAVLVAGIVSFILTGADQMRGMFGPPSVLKIEGKGYNDTEFRRTGSGSYELIISAAQAGDFSLYQAFMPLFGRATSREDVPKQFFIGRILLREAQEEFGIHPSDEEISSYIRKMRLFAGADGNFDQETYRTFIERSLGHLGMTESDLRSIASDAIVGEKLQAIVSTGLGTNRDLVATSLAIENQQIDAELARLDIDTYQDKIDPKEEDIKAYWEGIQDSFKTEETRKFTYVLISSASVPDIEPEKTAPAAADANDEAKAAAKKAEDDAKAAATAKTAEARRKKQAEVDATVDKFLVDLEEQKGTGFEDLAKKNGWEVKTTEAFALSNPPADLNLTLRSSSKGGKVADELFKIIPGTEAFSKISEAIPVGEGQWLVARLDANEKPHVKTYAEARADARGQYISEKGTEALKAAAEEAAKKIKDGLAAGKSFADAAKEAGIKEVKKVGKITSTYRPDSASEPQNLFETLKGTDPGALANNIVESDRAFIPYVEKREVVKDPNAQARLDAEVKNRSLQNQHAAFDSWLTARLEAAKVEEPQRKK